jgi:hypothetical protein
MLFFSNVVTPIKEYSQDEQNIVAHEYNLRQFIDVATRWKINAIFDSITDGEPFSIILGGFIKNARPFFDAFSNSLRKELSRLEKKLWAAYEIDLQDRFMPMLDLYKQWYNVNKSETEKFNPYNPYKLMFDMILSTENEVLKYFNESPKNIKNTKKEKVITLSDAWTKEKKHYLKVIEYLKEEYSLTQTPFLLEDKDGLHWICPNNQYLGAFLKKCKAYNFVKTKGITASDWINIFNLTFNLNISSNSDKPFRQQANFDTIYLDPFENLPRT